MSPIIQQWRASPHDSAESPSTPRPSGIVPVDQFAPPSVVRADTPAAKLSGPPRWSLDPIAVQSWSELQLSDCIESPRTRGSSVNVLPPSVVKRNVASVVPSDKWLLFAARPAQKSFEGHDNVSRWPTTLGSGSSAHDSPPSFVAAKTDWPSWVPPA